jgi:hypothetical protein
MADETRTKRIQAPAGRMEIGQGSTMMEQSWTKIPHLQQGWMSSVAFSEFLGN